MTLNGTDTNPVRLGNRFGWTLPMRTEDGRDFRVIVTDDALLGAVRNVVGIGVAQAPRI